MKPINSISILLLFTLVINACTPKMTFQTSSVVPAATGNVDVSKDKNKNYVINVNIANLAEPQRLTPSKDVYLVWMESQGSTAKKLGQISPSSGTFSKALKATLSATSVDEPSRVFITAENNADIQYPQGEVILTTERR